MSNDIARDDPIGSTELLHGASFRHMVEISRMWHFRVISEANPVKDWVKPWRALTWLQVETDAIVRKDVQIMIDNIRNIAFAAVAALGFSTAAAHAVPVLIQDNFYTGTLSGDNNLGLLDLAVGAFVFSGITGGSSGTLTVDLFSSNASQTSALGALQVLIQALEGATITFDTLKYDGIDLVLEAVTGGWAATISGQLPSKFEMAFSNANFADSIQISIAAVPLPAGGLLLIGGLGALALVRRRKSSV